MDRAECDRCGECGETFPASCWVLIPGSDDVVCKHCLNKYHRMHRGWRIEYDPMPFPGAVYHWFHPDADGAPDAAKIAENEGGYASTIAEAMADIDETIDQYAPLMSNLEIGCDIPEGLYASAPDEGAPRSAYLEIRDAQDVLWITLHKGGRGDPNRWLMTVANRILDCLQVPDVSI